jgi:hypothetical protein
MTLTAKGERWLLRAYQITVMTAVMGTLLIVIGLLGWVENGG